MKNHLEYRDEKTVKFWEVVVDDNKLILRWGKINTKGQTKEKVFQSNDKAIQEAIKLTSQKIKKGYSTIEALEHKPDDNKVLFSELSVTPHQLTFDGLRDSWLRKSFPSIDKKGFSEKFNALLDETIQKHPEFSPQVRAEIISNMCSFDQNHFKWKADRNYRVIVESYRKLLISAIIEILHPGFQGEEVTIDLLRNVINYEVLDAMFKAGIDPNSRFQTGAYWQAANSRADCFFRFVEEGANVKLLEDGEIHRSLLKFKFLKTLHDKGAELNVIDNDGRTPLFYAAWNPESLKLLIESGCNLDHVDKGGNTALSYIVRKWDPIQECKRLINLGASLDCPPNPAPLLTLLEKDLDSYQEDTLFKTVDYLIKKKVPIAQKDPTNGNTSLHFWAATDSKFSREICKRLIEAGADIDALNNIGQTPLMYAAEWHSIKSWKLLVSKKADINARSSNGYSICEWAVSRDIVPSEKFLKVLLETKGLKPVNDASSKFSTLGFLLMNYHYDAAMKFLDKGWKINDYVIDSICNQTGGETKKAIAIVSDFITATGYIEVNSLDSRYLNEIKKSCETTNNQTNHLTEANTFLKVWPPVFSTRKQIIVDNNVALTPPADVISFADTDEENEYANYKVDFSIWENSNRDRKGLIQAKENNHYEFLKENHDQLFNKFLLADNETLIEMWNDFIGKDINKFYTSRGDYCSYYDGSMFGIMVRDEELKYIIHRCGVLSIPGMLDAAKKKPNLVCKALMPVGSTKIATFMASLLVNSSVSKFVKKWLLRFPQHAIHGLIPIATSELCHKREHCESALRYIASNGHHDLVIEISDLHGNECKDAVNEILSVDLTIDYHSGVLPDIPKVLSEEEILPPKFLKTAINLSQTELQSLYGMMSLSKYNDVYPTLEKNLNTFDAKSLSEFSLKVFDIWISWEARNNSEKKLKKEAEWMYHSLAYMGDDNTVKKLIPYITTHWPKSGGMPKAVIGLDILASIGSDFAIRTINQILLKTKYKPLLERADDIMTLVAETRGFTKEELDDRLVPTFGLDNKESLTLDFGTRKFNIQINEKLVPSLLDSENKKIKDLPKAVKTDDKIKAKEATKFWKDLKADLKKEATNQLLRFEQAMLNGRKWDVKSFKSLVVDNPILCQLVRHLVWGVIKNEYTSLLFCINYEGRFLDVAGKEISLGDEEKIYIPHPLTIGSSFDDWKKYLVTNKINQPFPQISRQTYYKHEDKNNDFFGVNGAKVPAKAFRGLKSKGWIPEIGSGGTIWAYNKHLIDASVHLSFEGVVTMFEEGVDEDQTLQMSVYGKPTDLEFSEVVREIKNLIH